MKTRLLAVVQSERQRALAPAVVEVQRRRLANDRANASLAKGTLARVKRVLGLVYHTYRFADDVAALPGHDVVLPARGHKYDEVCSELTEAGLSPQRIAQGRRSGRTPLERIDAGMTLYAVLRAFLVTMRVWRSARLRPYVEVLVLTEALVPVLRGKPQQQYWVIIGDLTTTLIALASSCHSTAHKVITWQYSYLDFKRFPVRGDAAVILNDEGRALARRGTGFDDAERVYWRPRVVIQSLRVRDLEKGPIGALLNVHANHDAVHRLCDLQRRLGQPVYVRLHPNSSLGHSVWPDGLVLADATEPLEEFVARISLALCGNTQAQAKALCLGTPVIQCAGLDILPFDHHGYVRDGIVPGIQNITDFSFGLIRTFYGEPGYLVGLRKLLGPDPQDRAPGLEGLVCDLP